MGILEVLEVLSKNEKDEGKTLVSSPRGLQYLEKRFKLNLVQLNKIQSLTKKSIVLAFIAIFISLVSLIFVEVLKNYKIVNWTLIFLVFAVAFFSMLFTIEGIFYGLKNQKESLE
jgi:O-antigen/teichoic acid export membrane protein